MGRADSLKITWNKFQKDFIQKNPHVLTKFLALVNQRPALIFSLIILVCFLHGRPSARSDAAPAIDRTGLHKFDDETTFNNGGPPPPEQLTSMDFCAERCRFDPAMCTREKGHDYNRASYPAPSCKKWSKDLAGDVYFYRKHAQWWQNKCKNWGWSNDDLKNVPLNRTLLDDLRNGVNNRNTKTRKIVRWAGARARNEFEFRDKLRNEEANNALPSTEEACEERKFPSTGPMMYPDEFEFIVKTLANQRPRNYLEWGSGKSTSFFPLMASGNVTVLENYPPWCAKVKSSPVVRCLENAGRLKFACNPPSWPNGTSIEMESMGAVADPVAQKQAGKCYVELVDQARIPRYDAALVDGRHRVACALKLLAYFDHNSILFMHDFWQRALTGTSIYANSARYGIVLDYYDVIGRTRSVAALRKKSIEDMPNGGRNHLDAYKQHLALFL